MTDYFLGVDVGATLKSFDQLIASARENEKSAREALAAMGTEIKDVFPAGSDTGDTDALPLIWQEQDKFAQLLTAVEKSTAELRDAVAANDKAATMKAFKAVGESCKGCHDRYRKEKK